jgi:hypothetical protein
MWVLMNSRAEGTGEYMGADWNDNIGPCTGLRSTSDSSSRWEEEIRRGGHRTDH